MYVRKSIGVSYRFAGAEKQFKGKSTLDPLPGCAGGEKEEKEGDKPRTPQWSSRLTRERLEREIYDGPLIQGSTSEV